MAFGKFLFNYVGVLVQVKVLAFINDGLRVCLNNDFLYCSQSVFYVLRLFRVDLPCRYASLTLSNQRLSVSCRVIDNFYRFLGKYSFC